jgi:hypothetical protein
LFLLLFLFNLKKKQTNKNCLKGEQEIGNEDLSSWSEPTVTQPVPTTPPSLPPTTTTMTQKEDNNVIDSIILPKTILSKESILSSFTKIDNSKKLSLSNDGSIDTTSDHLLKHDFDVNCRICTGKVQPEITGNDTSSPPPPPPPLPTKKKMVASDFESESDDNQQQLEPIKERNNNKILLDYIPPTSPFTTPPPDEQQKQQQQQKLVPLTGHTSATNTRQKSKEQLIADYDTPLTYHQIPNIWSGYIEEINKNLISTKGSIIASSVANLNINLANKLAATIPNLSIIKSKQIVKLDKSFWLKIQSISRSQSQPLAFIVFEADKLKKDELFIGNDTPNATIDNNTLFLKFINELNQIVSKKTKCIEVELTATTSTTAALSTFVDKIYLIGLKQKYDEMTILKSQCSFRENYGVNLRRDIDIILGVAIGHKINELAGTVISSKLDPRLNASVVAKPATAPLILEEDNRNMKRSFEANESSEIERPKKQSKIEENDQNEEQPIDDTFNLIVSLITVIEEAQQKNIYTDKMKEDIQTTLKSSMKLQALSINQLNDLKDKYWTKFPDLIEFVHCLATTTPTTTTTAATTPIPIPMETVTNGNDEEDDCIIIELIEGSKLVEESVNKELPNMKYPIEPLITKIEKTEFDTKKNIDNDNQKEETFLFKKDLYERQLMFNQRKPVNFTLNNEDWLSLTTEIAAKKLFLEKKLKNQQLAKENLNSTKNKKKKKKEKKKAVTAVTAATISTKSIEEIILLDDDNEEEEDDDSNYDADADTNEESNVDKNNNSNEHNVIYKSNTNETVDDHLTLEKTTIKNSKVTTLNHLTEKYLNKS